MALFDIKPGSNPNSINLGSGGVVPVAILTTATFDAADVDQASLEIDIPTGPVEINVETEILVFADVTMSLLSPLDEADSEYVKMTSLTNILIKDRSSVLGQLIAPNGFIILQDDARLRGSAAAKSVQVARGGVALHHDAP